MRKYQYQSPAAWRGEATCSCWRKASESYFSAKAAAAEKLRRRWRGALLAKASASRHAAARQAHLEAIRLQSARRKLAWPASGWKAGWRHGSARGYRRG